MNGDPEIEKGVVEIDNYIGTWKMQNREDKS